MRVLHLTDPHLFADSDAALRGRNTHDTLSAVLTHYGEHDWQADVVLATGDLIQDDSAGAYQRFRDHLTPLGLPVLCVPGNHDVKSLMQDALSSPPCDYLGTFEADDWIVVSLDTAVDGEVSGTVSDAELDRVSEVIATSSASNALIGMHHPPVTMNSEWLDSVGLTNSDAVLQRLSDTGKVRVIVCGHVHQDYDAEHHGIRCITTPSTCRQFAQGSPTFAVDDLPPAYRKLEFAVDGSHNSELVWVPFS